MNRKNFAFVIFLFLGIFFQTQMSFSQLPNYLNYQAFLVDDTQHPLNGNYALGFALYSQETGGTPLWQELQSVNIVNGFMNVYLGTLIPLDLDFSREYWLEISQGTAAYPRTRLTTSPYSIRSNISTTVDDGAITQQKLAPSVQTIPKGPAGGDLMGIYPNPTLRVDSIISRMGKGMITQDMLNPNNVYLPGGTAGGDLTDYYPNPLISSNMLTGNRIITSINNGSINISGSRVLPQFGTQDMSTSGNITATTGTFTSLYINGQQVVPNGAAGGDLTGNYPNPAIKNNSVTDNKINAVSWNKITDVPVAAGELTGTYPNLTISSSAVSSDKIEDLSVTDGKINDVNWNKITNVPVATGSLTGTYPNLTIVSSAVSSDQIEDLSVTDSKINDVNWNKITNAPSTFTVGGPAGGDLSGTYPNPNIAVNSVTNAKVNDVNWSKITSTPTTLSGYGIMDAMNTSHPANSITNTDITNWNNKSDFDGDYTSLTNAPNIANSVSNKDITISSGGTLNIKDASNSLLYANQSNLHVGIRTTNPRGSLEIGGTDGIICTGTINSGTVQALGAGLRLQWYPRKGAFRVGNAESSYWDDDGSATPKLALYSIAMGYQPRATAVASTAIGAYNYATGDYSLSLGSYSQATASHSIAIGTQAYATGIYSIAIGSGCNTYGMDGAMVVGDDAYFQTAYASCDNELTMRFIGGFRLWSGYPDSSYGVYMRGNHSGWSNYCDRNRKTNFENLNPEEMLRKIKNMPITEWNYKGVDTVKYIGPMAQDFYAAFHLNGTDSLGISSICIDGVNMAGVQALILRTDEMKRDYLNQIAAGNEKISKLEKEVQMIRLLEQKNKELDEQIAKLTFKLNLLLSASESNNTGKNVVQNNKEK